MLCPNFIEFQQISTIFAICPNQKLFSGTDLKKINLTSLVDKFIIISVRETKKKEMIKWKNFLRKWKIN